MFQKRLKYKISQIKSYLDHKFSGLNINMIFGGILYILIVGVLCINCYNAYVKGMDDMRQYSNELQITNKIKQENIQLQNLYRYYNSIDYKKMYARDNLSLAPSDETLYYIQRDEPITIDPKTEYVPPTTVDNLTLWRRLLFNV